MDLISDSSSSFVGFYQVLIGLTGFIFVQLTWASYFRRKWSAWAWRSAERERHIFVQAHASTIVIIIKRRHRKKRWNEKQSWAIRCRGYINLRPSHDVIIDCFFSRHRRIPRRVRTQGLINHEAASSVGDTFVWERVFFITMASLVIH